MKARAHPSAAPQATSIVFPLKCSNIYRLNGAYLHHLQAGLGGCRISAPFKAPFKAKEMTQNPLLSRPPLSKASFRVTGRPTGGADWDAQTCLLTTPSVKCSFHIAPQHCGSRFPQGRARPCSALAPGASFVFCAQLRLKY